MKTKKKKYEFSIKVTRTSICSEMVFILADTEEEAKKLALGKVFDLSFCEHEHSSYAARVTGNEVQY